MADVRHFCQTQMRVLSLEGGRGLLSDSRDPVDEPMSFVSFTAAARVSLSLTNPRPCFAHVDAI